MNWSLYDENWEHCRMHTLLTPALIGSNYTPWSEVGNVVEKESAKQAQVVILLFSASSFNHGRSPLCGTSSLIGKKLYLIVGLI